MTHLDRLFTFSSWMPRALVAVLTVALVPACSSSDNNGSGSTGEPDDEVVDGGGGNGADQRGGDGGGNGGDQGGGDDGGGDTPVTAFVASGTVVDGLGKPLPNVEIVVDNQLLYDSNETGKTDARGRYRIELPSFAATWHASATHSVEYHGTTYVFSLHPNDDSAFAGNTGGVRNFEWKLSGTRPDDGFYGAYVVGYTEPGDFDLQVTDVELTLVPDGPLVDGSKGETVSGKFVSTPDGDAVQDIPLGRYTISAELEGVPLGIRIRNSGAAYEESLTSDFDAPYGSLPIYNLEVELELPE